jgi:alanine dehydrogenase
LTNATLAYVLRLAEQGADAALDRDPLLARGLNVAGGEITHDAVSAAVTEHGVLAADGVIRS